MKYSAILWLRVSYWSGAILDVLTGLVMTFPGLFAILNRPARFEPGLDYRYAMGMGAPLMFAWAVLLLWADRKPVERRGILPITLLVVAGEVLTQVWGIAAGFLPLLPMLPSFAMQTILIVLFVVSYHKAGEASA